MHGENELPEAADQHREARGPAAGGHAGRTQVIGQHGGARDQVHREHAGPAHQQPGSEDAAQGTALDQRQMRGVDQGQNQRRLLAQQGGQPADEVPDPVAPAPPLLGAQQEQPGGEREHDQQAVVAPRNPGDGFGQRRMGRVQEPAEQGDTDAVAEAQQQQEQQARAERGEKDVRQVIAVRAGGAPGGIERVRRRDQRAVVGMIRPDEGK